LSIVNPNGHYRWLIQDNAFFFHVDQGIRSPQINRQIAGKQASQAFEHNVYPKLAALSVLAL